mgnify:CR=1 FL=1
MPHVQGGLGAQGGAPDTEVEPQAEAGGTGVNGGCRCTCQPEPLQAQEARENLFPVAPPSPRLSPCRSPHFMAPEQLNSKTEPASDIWSAGIMAYQLLSGAVPFDDVKNPKSPSLSLVWCAFGGEGGEEGVEGDAEGWRCWGVDEGRGAHPLLDLNRADTDTDSGTDAALLS